MFFVSRQISQEGTRFVEVVSRVGDIGPDMLAPKYPGEGGEYDDPREAVATALSVASRWGKAIQEGIEIRIGSVPMDTEDARKWADTRFESLPKCDYCGDLLGADRYTTLADPDGRYCSGQCAEIAEFELTADYPADG